MRQLINNARQLGEIVRARRRARRLSQTDVARRLGISQGYLSMLETDPAALTLERLLLLLKLLGLELVIQEAPHEDAKPKAQW